MITFKAKYADTVKIKQIQNNSPKYCNATIVEINPSSRNDYNTIKDITETWDMGESFALNILDSIETESYLGDFSRFFALTLQKNNYRDLDPSKVLGLVEVHLKPNKPLKISTLQVDPKNNMHCLKASYRKIGTAILNFIKEKFPTRDIELISVFSAVEFYKANGFVNITPSVLKFKR